MKKHDVRGQYEDDNPISRLIYFSYGFKNTAGYRGMEWENTEEACMSYKKYPAYGKACWEIKERPNKDGYRIANANEGKELSADLMNGWKLPLKIYFGIKGQGYGALYSELDKYNGEDPICFLQEKSGRHNRELAESVLGFLESVYTVGNMIPTGTKRGENPGGCGYDGYDYKLWKIHMKFNESPQAESIGTAFFGLYGKDGWHSFIKEHYLEDYVTEDGGKVIRIRDGLAIGIDEDSFRPLTDDDDQLLKYFKNVTKRIDERTRKIYG